MSSTKNSLLETVKKQYMFKLRLYINLFISLIVVQVIAILFSSGGVGSHGTSTGNINFFEKTFSSDIIIVFSLMWAFFAAVLLTTRDYRDMDFVFIGNRVSSNISNMVFLATASLVAGFTAVLGGVLPRVILYYSLGPHHILSDNYFLSLGDLSLAVLATFLYLILICALGYFCGMLVQLSKAFVVIIPALFFGTLITASAREEAHLVDYVFNFFVEESSLSLFLVKVIFTAAVLFGSSLLMSNRLEVRK